jgi:hypothetical protein
MSRIRARDELEFAVFIERIPTSDMLYAVRHLEGGQTQTYVVKDTAFSERFSFVKSFSVGDELCITVRSSDPDFVIRAESVERSKRHSQKRYQQHGTALKANFVGK